MSIIQQIRSLTDDNLKAIIAESTSLQGVLRNLGVNIKNDQVIKFIKQFIEENNIDISHHTMGRPLYSRISYETTKELVEKNICWTDLMTDLGIRFVGNNIKTVKKLVKHYKLDTSHFDAKKASVKNHPKVRKDNEIFCKNSVVHRKVLKDRIIKLNLLPYECNKCKLTNCWHNEPLVLHLEHKNGIGDDNRLDNLCFLCPNCHSQTSTYAGRNILGTKRDKNGSFHAVDTLNK